MRAHRCAECRHSDHDHSTTENRSCSEGFCRCRQLRSEVKQTGEAITITPIPAYNPVTGKWAAR